jgi:hypothetical protein
VFQWSVQNLSNNANASTDIVAENDIGTDSTNYVDMGINSSVGGASAYPTGAGEAYLYNESQDLAVGTIAAKTLHFFTNSADALTFNSSGTATFTNSFALPNGSTATTQTVGDNTTKVATDAFVIANAGSTSFANPTASIGLTVINGSATTAMRSDAAQPISQAIVPTWTGLHTFSVTDTSSSGNAHYGLQITPTVNQTSTAGFTDLIVNRTQTAAGSGTQHLLDLEVGGTSKFSVDNAGNVNILSGANIQSTANLTLQCAGSAQTTFNVGGTGFIALSSAGNITAAKSIIFSAIGTTVAIKSGSNSKAGTFTLSAGTATVSNTSIDANSVIVATLKTVGGTITGPVYYPTVTPGTGFTVAETGGVTDTSTYNYVILEVN